MVTKKFTILHSNDMHGDFLAEVKAGDSSLVGGLSLLSGYINKVRKEEENVIFAISGDMLQGSIIDAEYRGISTIEIMNYLAPDVVTLGNHEFDYGLPHLLFLEKMANFPIVNANLYMKNFHKRLMKPHHIINMAGFDILFIGIITEKVIDAIAQDKEVGSFITLTEASEEVGRIINAYKDEDIDLTVLLTHIGFDSDKELARLLKPEWGVDMIIGGHSHTILDKPEEINNILITQAGVGTNQIGRFDIVVDDDTNSIVDYRWQLIPIDNSIARPDEELQKYINSFKEIVDRKYNTLVCKMAEKLTHPRREVETSLGNLFSDIFAKRTNADVAFTSSGSIRSKELGPLVTLGDLFACYAFDDPIYKCQVSGDKLYQVFSHIMRPENRTGEGECYQVNQGIKAIYNEKEKHLEHLSIRGELVNKEDVYSITLQGYHYINSASYLKISREELQEISIPKVVSTSGREILEEYLRNNQNLSSKVEGRLVYY